MIFISNWNKYVEPFIKKNHNKFTEQKSIFFQDIYPQIDLNGLISISFMRDRTIWITEDGTLYAIGKNLKGQINGIKTVYDTPQKIIFDDKNLRFSSAVGGNDFTLYLTMSDNPSLILSNSLANEGKPTIIPLLDHQKPVSLFGGECHCGSIDSTGSSIIISISNQPNILYLSLPNDEKIVSLSLCNKFVLALSSTGKVYSSEYLSTSQFNEIDELKNIKIDQITGKSDHAIVVSADGRVFSKGSNSCGQLGHKYSIQNSNKFIQIETIDPSYKVIDAYAGHDCSYFILEDGKLLYCGDHESNVKKLITQSHHFIDFIPSETFIYKGCNFCISEEHLTIVFIDCKPPSNTPNQRIGECFVNQLKSQKESSSLILKNSFLWRDELYVQSKEISEINNGYIRVFNYLSSEDNLIGFENSRDFLKSPEFDKILYNLTGEKVSNEVEIGDIKSLCHIYKYLQKITKSYNDLSKDDRMVFLQEILYLFVLRDVTISNLLKKCNSLLHKYKIHINNFDYDFIDGNVFLILIRLATSNNNLNYSNSTFSEENLKNIIITSKIPYFLEPHSIKEGNSCLIMFQTYAIIERISDENIIFNENEIVYNDIYPPLLNAINGICSIEFGFSFTKLENILYGPDLIRFVNLLIKDSYLDEIVTFSPTSIIKLEHSKKMIDFVLNYLKKKDDIFRIHPFYFGQIEEGYKKLNNANIQLSIDQFFTSLLDKFFIKSTEIEMFTRCNILIGKKKQITSITDFKDGIAFVYLLNYLINPFNDEILNTASFKMISDFFKKAKVVMIINESILISPESNKRFILYQLQFIFNAFDQSSFGHIFIEYLKSKNHKLQKIKVPAFYDLKDAILANRYFSALKSTNKINYELNLEKRIKSIKQPQTYRERIELNSKNEEVKEKDEEEESESECECERQSLSDDDFWNTNDADFGFENGIIIDKSLTIIDNDYTDAYNAMIQDNQSLNPNAKYKKSTMNYYLTVKNQITYYWSDCDCSWCYTNTDLSGYCENRKTPIVLFIDSDEDEMLSLISNTINMKVDRIVSKKHSIFGSCIATPQLSSYTINNNQKKLKKIINEIMPLFIFTNVNDNTYSKLEAALLKFYSRLLDHVHLVVIILKENFISYQIETIKNVYHITKCYQKEREDDNYPEIEFLLVSNSNKFTAFDSNSIDLFNKSEFVSKLKQEFTFNINCTFINIDNKESYKPFIDTLTTILVNKTQLIYKLTHEDQVIKKVSIENRKFISLMEKARELDKKEEEVSGHYYKPNILLYSPNFANKLSGLYMRIITHQDKYDIASILYARYKLLKRFSSSKKKALEKWGEEIRVFTFNSDQKFAKIVNDVKFRITAGTENIESKIQKELKISSDQRLNYLESVLNDRMYWTTAQLTVMKNSHVRFLKKEFLDIILLINNQTATYAFDRFNSIFENQLQNDKRRIDLMFKNFFLMIEKKKKTSIKQIKDEMRKSTPYILKERENMKEIKIALEVGQKLETVIPQDF